HGNALPVAAHLGVTHRGRVFAVNADGERTWHRVVGLVQIPYPGSWFQQPFPSRFLADPPSLLLRYRIRDARRKPVAFPPREFKFSSLQTVPAPLHDERFSKKSADQSEWRDSVQVQPRKTGTGIRQVAPADQLRNQHSPAPYCRATTGRRDVVPVKKSQEISMAVAATPCHVGIFSR